MSPRSRATTARLLKEICVGTARLNKQTNKITLNLHTKIKIVTLLHINYTVHSLQFLAKKIFCEQDMHALAALSKVCRVEDLVVVEGWMKSTKLLKF